MTFRAVVMLAMLWSGLVQAVEPDWRLYDQLLQQYTAPIERGGIRLRGVDYQGLTDDPRWPQLRRGLADFDPAELRSLAERKAFYINLYNIFAIDLVLRHAPLDSIRDIGNWFYPVWRRPAGVVGGSTLTLEQIEHQILRPMGDPRIHMAIVCASLSCPDLAAEAYRAERLEAQLEQQTRRFLANPTKGLRQQGETLWLSQIFRWFAADFDAAGGVRAWLSDYGVAGGAPLIEYLDYDWRLNGR